MLLLSTGYVNVLWVHIYFLFFFELRCKFGEKIKELSDYYIVVFIRWFFIILILDFDKILGEFYSC
jgi:hypothetical protein